MEDRMFLRKDLGLATMCFAAFLATATAANSADAYRVCIGEKEHDCPASHNLYASCGANPHNVAKETCTIFEDGKPAGGGRYRLRHDDSASGGHCGYEFYSINCVD
jgi:hypothetical protein